MSREVLKKIVTGEIRMDRVHIGTVPIATARCCKMCRHFQAAAVGANFEPLDAAAKCAILRRRVSASDSCEELSLSLWGAAFENTKRMDGEAK